MLDSQKVTLKVFCSNCAAQNNDSAIVCKWCGNQLTLVESIKDEATKSSQGAAIDQYITSITNNKTPTAASLNSFRRAKRGGIIFGICKGLENSGRGSAVTYRVMLSLVSLFLTGLPIIIYIIVGIIVPVDDN